MPYSFIASVLVLTVAIRFFVTADAPVRVKVFVAVVLLISLVGLFGFPQWHLVALLVQGSLGVGLVLYSKLAHGPSGGQH